MEIIGNDLFLLLLLGSTVVFTSPTIVLGGALKLLVAHFFVRPEVKETVYGLRQEAKELLALAQAGDEDSKRKIQESFTDKKSRFYGVFRVRSSNQHVVLATELSRPAALAKTRDREGDIVWRTSSAGVLKE